MRITNLSYGDLEMKTIFEVDDNFDADGPDKLLRMALADNMASVLWDFSQWLRTEIRHKNKPYDEVQEAFFDLLDQEGINLDQIWR